MKRLLLLYCICIMSQVAVAQCKPTITLSISGCANTLADKLAVKAAEAEANYYIEQMGIGFNSLQECNAFRNAIISISFGSGSCRVRYNVSPCMGCQNRAMGEANILAIGQGNTFYSTNGANEIRDWSNDYIERMLALNPDYPYFDPANVPTGDPEFDNARNVFISINMRDEQGNLIEPKEYYFGEVLGPNDERWKYYTEKEYLDELHSEYYNLTNINIKEILYKSEKTDSDIEMLKSYQEWIEQKLAEITIFKDMAILSAVEYADADLSLLNHTKYRIITEAPDKEMNRVLKLTDLSNNESLNQGFHADWFHNEETNEYTLAFRGTKFPEAEDYAHLAADRLLNYALKKITTPNTTTLLKEVGDIIKDIAEGNTDKLPYEFHDLSTNVSQAIGKVLTQYKMAIQIGEAIKSIKEENPNIKINITGHSKGGGQGIIAGLVSGQPTYVFNPAGVNDATYEFANVSNKVASGDYNNIHKIRTTDDILTNFQESKSGLRTIPKAIGKEYTIITNEGHSIEPVAHLFIKEEAALEVISKGEVEQSIKIYTE